MKNNSSLPLRIWFGAWLDIGERGSRTMRLSSTNIGITLASVLLAACAGTGQESVADATATKQAIKVKATQAGARRHPATL